MAFIYEISPGPLTVIQATDIATGKQTALNPAQYWNPRKLAAKVDLDPHFVIAVTFVQK